MGGCQPGVTMNDMNPTNPATDDGYVAPPAQLTPAPVAALPALSRTAFLARIGLLGMAAAALVAATILILGSTAAPTGTLAAGNGTDGANDSPLLLNPGGPGRKGHMFGFGGITITAINGNNISLETVDGWTRTITVDGDTTYSKSGDTIALGDLKVGDEIGFRQTREDDGSWTIDAIAVILPHVGGEVTAVSGSTITVDQRDGTTATITVNGQTDYSVNGDDAALADVEVGMFLVAEGTKDSDGNLTATQVKAVDPDSFPGKGDHFGRGFGFRFGRHVDGSEPDATTAPCATGSAS